ncbi:MAG: site-specific integrase [Clostridia bacterium]|nr:site-specific integrase [Clostridia bacterium]
MAKAVKLPSGSWRVQVYIGRDPGGKRIIESITAPTKTEAELLAAQRKMTATCRVEKMTLREAYGRYIEAKTKVLSDSTLRNYKRMMNNSTSRLMNKQITAISAYDIQRAVNEYAADHSPKSVKNRYGLFTAVMKMFLPDKRFYATLPQSEKHDIYIPDRATIVRIYEKAKGTFIELPFLLTAFCGMRASEIAGLKYDCVDHAAGMILVRRASVPGAETGYVLKAPKTKAGYREIPAPSAILDLIGTGKPSEFVISEYKRNHLSMEWKRFMDRTGEKYFSLHKLRHFYASIADLVDVPERYAAELMGHADSRTTKQIYQHTFDDAKAEFASRISTAGSSILTQ